MEGGGFTHINSIFFSDITISHKSLETSVSQHINHVITLQLADYQILLYLDLRKILFSPLAQSVVRLLYEWSRNRAVRDTVSSDYYGISYTYYYQFVHSSRLSVAHVSNDQLFPTNHSVWDRGYWCTDFFVFNLLGGGKDSQKSGQPV